MNANQTFTREQIAALSLEQAVAAYDLSKVRFDSLLKQVETDNAKKVTLQEELQAARLQYILLRARIYPKHFAMVQTAA